MKLIAYIIITLLVNVSQSWASLYDCSSPSGKPRKVKESIKTELSLSKMIPFITSNELNRKNLEYKSPFLIYYAIDSSEDFMQYSVRFEIAKLQASCKRNSNVQFIAFLNSLYVEKNSFILCKNQEISTVNLNKYPSLNNKLILKRKYISSGDHSLDLSGSLKYVVNYSKETNKPFGEYPLAHPDFLYDLIRHAITEKSLFPNENYAAFINLKSHGSKDHVLAGMHDCQRKAKMLSSKYIIKNILRQSEIKFLNQLDTPTKVESKIVQYENIISKLELGSSRGVGSFSENPKLGGNRLGGNRLSIAGSGLGNAFSGLGVNEGLGAEYAFGTDQNHLGLILDDLFKEGSNKTLGFLMLESCESNRNPSIFHTNLSNIFGYYTAKKSLWYRNLNWWEILERANGLTVNMVNILQEETSKIPNIEVVNK